MRIKFFKIFILIIYFISGFFVRGSKFLIIIYKNLSIFIRDIYINNNIKLICILIRYDKMRVIISREYFTVRFIN